MFRRLNPLLVRLSRWPRRLAALACLALATASAFAPADGTPPDARSRDPVASRLHDGQVAVPVAWDAAASSDLVRPGMRVGIYGSPDEDIGPSLVADRLLVLSVHQPADALSGGGTVIVVAADRVQAARLAATARAPTLVVLDGGP